MRDKSLSRFSTKPCSAWAFCHWVRAATKLASATCNLCSTGCSFAASSLTRLRSDSKATLLVSRAVVVSTTPFSRAGRVALLASALAFMVVMACCNSVSSARPSNLACSSFSDASSNSFCLEVASASSFLAFSNATLVASSFFITSLKAASTLSSSAQTSTRSF